MIERIQGGNVDPHSEAIKTAKTIQEISQTLLPNAQAPHPYNPNIFQAPIPDVSPIHNPRSAGNEQLLLSENKTLKDRIEKLEKQVKRLQETLNTVYKIQTDARSKIDEKIALVSKAAFDAQNDVYEAITKSE